MQYFISYSRQNQTFVFKLVHDLKAAGVRVWMDQLDVPPGVRWDDFTQQALHQSEGIIAVLTPAAVQSQNVKDELAYAVNNSKRLVPIILEPCEVPFRVERMQRVDFTTDYDTALQQLLAALKAPIEAGKEKKKKPPLRPVPGGSQPMAGNPFATALLKNGFRLLGLLLILLAVLITSVNRCLSNGQYFTIYALIGVGIALVLVHSAEQAVLKARFKQNSLYLAGGVVVSMVLFFTNPIGSFKQDDCRQPATTSLTVFVHGKGGRQDMILRQQGFVLMDVNGERKKASINENGQAFFQNLRLGDSIKLDIDFSEPYKALKPDSSYFILTHNGHIYLAVALQGLDRLKGTVLYRDQPLPGVIVRLDGRNGSLYDTTDAGGAYAFHIPDSLQKKDCQVWFIKSGFNSKQATAYPQTGQDLNIIMER